MRKRNYQQATVPAEQDTLRTSLYEDTGCDISSSCFTCPLSMCKYDSPAEYRRYKRGIHDTAVMTRVQQDGLTIRETAVEFQLTERTIYRILAGARTR